MFALTTLATLLIVALGGCGSSDQTSAAASCLRSALAQQAVGDNSNNCADQTALKAAGSQVPGVTCTHQQGNEYVCHTAARSFDPFHVANEFFQVTYDGKTIVYQQTQ